MSSVEFVWDAENTKHLARHNITPEEAEEALQLEPLIQESRSIPAKNACSVLAAPRRDGC